MQQAQNSTYNNRRFIIKKSCMGNDHAVNLGNHILLYNLDYG